MSRRGVFRASRVTDRSNSERSNSEYLAYIVGQSGASKASCDTDRSFLGISCHGQEYLEYLVSRTGVFWATRVMDRSTGDFRWELQELLGVFWD